MHKDARAVRRDPRAGREAAPAEGEPDSIGHSAHEVLRHKDFAAMTPEELAAARALIAAMVTRPPDAALAPAARAPPRARARHARAWPATRSPPAATRCAGAFAGARRRRASSSCCATCRARWSPTPARCCSTCTRWSGSGRGVEVFAFGTRLTRLTAELRTRDPELALARAADRVVDWASGTRIGASLKRYNDVWGRRALTRGAVVLIASDGWERQDHELVGREMARLHRAAYAVVWVNPVKGSPDYQPLAAGMRAALPSIDRFVAGHNLASLEALAGLLARIERRHGR